MTNQEAIDALRYFVQKTTKWSEGAEELAREYDVSGALDTLEGTLGLMEAVVAALRSAKVDIPPVEDTPR